MLPIGRGQEQGGPCFGSGAVGVLSADDADGGEKGENGSHAEAKWRSHSGLLSVAGGARGAATNQSSLRRGQPLTALKAQESASPSMRFTTAASAQNPDGGGSPGPTGPVWAFGPQEFSMCPYSLPPIEQ